MCVWPDSAAFDTASPPSASTDVSSGSKIHEMVLEFRFMAMVFQQMIFFSFRDVSIEL